MTKEYYKNLSGIWGKKDRTSGNLSLQFEIIVYITHYIKQNRKLINYIVKPNKLPRK